MMDDSYLKKKKFNEWMIEWIKEWIILKSKTKQRMILTSISGVFVVHGMDSSQRYFTDSFVVSKSSHPNRVLTNQAHLRNGLSCVCVCGSSLIQSTTVYSRRLNVSYRRESP